MDKQNMIYPYNGILFSHKKERSTDTCCNIDEPGKCDVTWKKPDIKGHILYDTIYIKYPE